MKKVFLAVLVAGLFVACGNKNTEAEATDSAAVVEEEVVVEEVAEPVQEVAEVATEEVAAPAATPEKKNEIAEDIKAGGEAASAIIGAVKEDKKSTNNRGNR